jgi:hypothetical protein
MEVADGLRALGLMRTLGLKRYKAAFREDLSASRRPAVQYQQGRLPIPSSITKCAGETAPNRKP